MKILLITTGGNKNPGDQFIRLGVESLIRSVCPPGAVPYQLVRVDKESEEIGIEQDFDRAILCGMPLWWNNEASVSQEIGWWGPLMDGWISAEKRKFLVLGAGPATGASGPLDVDFFNDAMHQTVQRAWAVTSRQEVKFPGVLTSVCPAAFSVSGTQPRRRLLCNLMPDGAHDSHFNGAAAAEWQRRLYDVSEALRPAYDFVAHSPDEAVLARTLGWPVERIHFPDTPEALLKLYEETKIYFGNRLHGAMAVAVAGGTSVAVGYDSRIDMLRHFTPHRWSPFGVPTNNLPEHLGALVPRLNRARLAQERFVNTNLMHHFLFDQ